MLKFKKIRFKNILSFGDIFQEFDLTSANTTLFQGESGSGKSTILSAFCFGLFGKPFAPIKKNNLVNSINNSNLLVEIEFQVGNKDYKIVRGIKPNIFEIYLDGKLINQDAKVLDYQDYLEKQILKFNMKSFLQISILGAANFVPFMQLSASERRSIIEEILDIKSFSLMNDVVKNDLQKLNSDIMSLDNKKALLEKEIEIHLSYKQKDIKEIESRKLEIKSQMNIINEENKKYFDSISKLSNNENSILTEIKKFETAVSKLNNEKRNIDIERRTEENRYTKQVEFLDKHDNCDFCLQQIDRDHKSFIKNKVSTLLDEINIKYNNRIKDIDDKLQKCTESPKLKSLQESALKFSSGISQLKNKIQVNDIKKSSLNSELRKLIDIDVKPKTEDIIIENNKIEVKKIDEQLKTLVNDRYICELALKLLKDDGIKTDIIIEYLPVINSLINEYLQKMNFFVTFNLDENFKETIKSRGRDDFEYGCFSEGEKQRLDLAILFTWRSIARIKNSLNTNLLIMDEIADSKLNNEAAENVWDVLKSEEFNNSNVFVVSHKNTISDKFDKVYNFSKPGNFSITRLLD